MEDQTELADALHSLDALVRQASDLVTAAKFDRAAFLGNFLKSAARSGLLRMTEACLERGATAEDAAHALHYAIAGDHCAVARCLAAAGAPLTAAASLRAARSGSLKVLTWLHESGHQFDTFGSAPLAEGPAVCFEANECYQAAARGHGEALRLLHSWGVLSGHNLGAAVVGGLFAKKPSIVRLCVKLGAPLSDVEAYAAKLHTTNDVQWWLTLADMKTMPYAREELAASGAAATPTRDAPL